MFLVRYANASGDLTVLRLHPRPTEVDYPDRFLYSTTVSKDGAVIVQRPMRDDRTRRWIWRGYRSTIVPFEQQWKTLSSLAYKTRLTAGRIPTVEIWENDSTEDCGFGLTTNGQPPNFTTYSNLVFTTVKFLQVTRKTRKGGGPATFDEAFVEFIVEDPDFLNF